MCLKIKGCIIIGLLLINNKMKNIYILFTYLLIAFPSLSFATDLASMITRVKGVFDAAFPVAVSAAVVYFAWQVIQYTIAKGGKEALSGIVWGLIGITVIVAVWGFVGAIESTLGV